MNSVNLRRSFAILALSAIVVAGACGSNDDSPTVAAQPGNVESSTTTTTAPAGSSDTTASTAASKSGSWQPGQYKGPITGGYKGDEISFTVKDDGKTISDIVFTGNWKCADGTKLMDVGHVPNDYSVNPDGTWGGEQREPYLLWTVTGAPEGSGGGTGTIRIEYDTECDTYKLNWTATRQ